MILFLHRTIRITLVVVLGFCLAPSAFGVIRDGGVDPANLGQGGWIYVMKNATNHMSPNNIPSVTNQNSLMQYLKSQGLNFVIVKAATSNALFSVAGGNVAIGSPSAAFNTALVNAAHDNGLKIFGSNRSFGNDIPGEIAVADYVFQQGADGFIYDAESEWEASPSRPWITNAPVQAWQLCSTVRSHWPTKFIAHNPYDTLYLHSIFPYKEFGYWADTVMPQVYHHAASAGNAIAAIHWTDWNYQKFQDSLYALAPSVIDGQTIYWTNAIKPLLLMRDVYNGGAGTPVHPDTDVRNFLDYLVADPNCVTAGGYNGSDYFRSELHSAGQWDYIKAATIGHFPGVVNNIVIDDARATRVGEWTMVKTMDANANTVIFSGEEAGDLNSFGTNYWKKAQGSGSAYMQFTPTIITAGNYNLYQWSPTRSDASAAVPFVINHNNGTTTNLVNQQTNSGNWTLVGRFNFAAGTNGNIRVMDDVSGAGSVALVDGLKLVYVPPVTELILDNTDPGVTFVGDWQTGSSAPDKFDADYRFASSVSGGASNVTYRPQLDLSGYYDVYIWYSQGVNRAPDAPWTIHYHGGSTNVPVNQQINGGQWNLIGSAIPFLQGTNGSVELSNNASPKVVLADAVRFVYVSGLAAPDITEGPQPQTARVGTNVTFRVTADGTAPFIYQWRFNGTNIPAATESAYTRFNIHTNDAGAYSVTITNAVGFDSSSNAILTVTLPERAEFQSITHESEGGVNLIISGDVGISYSIDRSTNLIDWETLTNVVNSNGTIQFLDPTATNRAKSFYRARE